MKLQRGMEGGEKWRGGGLVNIRLRPEHHEYFVTVLQVLGFHSSVRVDDSWASQETALATWDWTVSERAPFVAPLTMWFPFLKLKASI